MKVIRDRGIQKQGQHVYRYTYVLIYTDTQQATRFINRKWTAPKRTEADALTRSWLWCLQWGEVLRKFFAETISIAWMGAEQCRNLNTNAEHVCMCRIGLVSLENHKIKKNDIFAWCRLVHSSSWKLCHWLSTVQPSRMILSLGNGSKLSKNRWKLIQTSVNLYISLYISYVYNFSLILWLDRHTLQLQRAGG